MKTLIRRTLTITHSNLNQKDSEINFKQNVCFGIFLNFWLIFIRFLLQFVTSNFGSSGTRKNWHKVSWGEGLSSINGKNKMKFYEKKMFTFYDEKINPKHDDDYTKSIKPKGFWSFFWILTIFEIFWKLVSYRLFFIFNFRLAQSSSFVCFVKSKGEHATLFVIIEYWPQIMMIASIVQLILNENNTHHLQNSEFFIQNNCILFNILKWANQTLILFHRKCLQVRRKSQKWRRKERRCQNWR